MALACVDIIHDSMHARERVLVCVCLKVYVKQDLGVLVGNVFFDIVNTTYDDITKIEKKINKNTYNRFHDNDHIILLI